MLDNYHELPYIEPKDMRESFAPLSIRARLGWKVSTTIEALAKGVAINFTKGVKPCPSPAPYFDRDAQGKLIMVPLSVCALQGIFRHNSFAYYAKESITGKDFEYQQNLGIFVAAFFGDYFARHPSYINDMWYFVNAIDALEYSSPIKLLKYFGDNDSSSFHLLGETWRSCMFNGTRSTILTNPLTDLVKNLMTTAHAIRYMGY